ncbi:uncharacterized protein PFLUO_LOCUS25 [Penicillium psychrofluorescens]|uniref:uncharacterized protein n=1 Tax=Penicillium psychrofluorescens TaxID=3158075 RepID=UPI003CCCC83B
MKVIQCLEDFGGPNDPVAFQCTHIFYENEGQFYRGLSKERHISKDDFVLSDFYQTDSIPTNNFYPEYHQKFTRAYGNCNGNWYLKRPQLSKYDPNYPDEIKDQVLHEVQICEFLTKHPHPNIAQYHGCDVHNGFITGIYFTKYSLTLMERVNPKKLSKLLFALDRKTGGLSIHEQLWLDQVERALRHLHSLGIAHNDINPTNIMVEGDKAVIIDFDSCRFYETDVGLVKSTYQWHDEKVTTARPLNDLDALEEIRLWLSGDVDRFKFDA